MNYAGLLFLIIPLLIGIIALVLGILLLKSWWKKTMKPRVSEWCQDNWVSNWWRSHEDNEVIKHVIIIWRWLRKKGKPFLWPVIALVVFLIVKMITLQRLISYFNQSPIWVKYSLFLLGIVLLVVIILVIKWFIAAGKKWIGKKEESLKPNSIWFLAKLFVKWVIVPVIPVLLIVNHYSGSFFPSQELVKEIEMQGIVIIFLRKYFLLYLFWLMVWAIFLRMKEEGGGYKHYILYPVLIAGVWLVLNFTPLLPKKISMEAPKKCETFQLLKPDRALYAMYESVKKRPNVPLRNCLAEHKDDHVKLGLQVKRDDIIVVCTKGRIRYGFQDTPGKDVRAGRVFKTRKTIKELRDPNAHPFSPVIGFKPSKFRPVGAFIGSSANPEEEESLFFLRVLANKEGELYLLPCNMPRRNYCYGSTEYGYRSNLSINVYHIPAEKMAKLANQ